ncbi:unnamed protein product [Prorocentrum cordatum]|uniref:Uncharacterized protein n=1 Tax=Prorocentrum cordatum TaxID=2364126 RepID=A0ABN9V5M5_9DINO|nr:unnamed protein product [Polarella glacialis]
MCMLRVMDALPLNICAVNQHVMGTSAIPRHPAQSNASSGPSDAVAGKARADAREKPVALRGGEAKAARMEGGGGGGRGAGHRRHMQPARAARGGARPAKGIEQLVCPALPREHAPSPTIGGAAGPDCPDKKSATSPS